MSIVDVVSWLFILAGALLGIAGLMLQTGVSIASLKLLLIFIFLFFSSPTATHALANAALLGGLKPELDEDYHGHRPD